MWLNTGVIVLFWYSKPAVTEPVAVAPTSTPRPPPYERSQASVAVNWAWTGMSMIPSEIDPRSIG